MAADHKQQQSRGAPALDETLRLYLLCRLNEAERLRLDERVLVDHELAERIVLVESELTDDYVAGRLDANEQKAFADRFLVTGDRRRQLRFTSALQDFSRSRAASPVSVTTRPARPSWGDSIAALFRPNRPAWVLAGSLALLILFVAVAWFLTQQRPDSTPLIARHESPQPLVSPQTSPSGSVQSAVGSPSPTPTPKPETIPSPAEPPATIASFVLLPGAARSGGELTRVAVPAGKRDVVRLILKLEEATGPGVYRVQLTTAEGQTVPVSSKLRSDAGKVSLDIPANQLPGGDYQIKLTQKTADGQSETVGRFYFRALKR